MSGHGAEVEVPHGDNDPFTKKVAFCVAMFAVVLAVAGAAGKSAGKDVQMNQVDASNKWSHYQSKTDRELSYTQERETYEQIHGVLSDAEAAKYSEEYEAINFKQTKPQVKDNAERQKLRLGYITTKLKEYRKEKPEIKETAEKYEKARALAHRKDGYFDYAELALQFAILLASIAMLAKVRWPVMFSIVLAVIGLALTAGGYIIPAHAPNIHVPLIDPEHHEEEKH
jgi:Domain of unknown function (DUF4337)